MPKDAQDFIYILPEYMIKVRGCWSEATTIARQHLCQVGLGLSVCLETHLKRGSPGGLILPI